MLTREQFLEYLRDALNHLYEPERLRRSPFAALFGVAERFDAASALQRILVDAIASLKPAAGEPHQSPAWQIYEPLFYRYVEQLSADEVADQLGIGTRHLRRWQSAAHEALADLLWQQFGLADRLVAPRPDDAHIGKPAGPAGVLQELAWLKDASATSATDLAETLPAVFDLAGRLAARHNVCLSPSLARDLPKVGVSAVALRQILIHLLSVVIPRAAGGKVTLAADLLRWDVTVRVQCLQYPAGPKPPPDGEAENLNMARQLAELSGCCLALTADARGFDARLILPALEQIPVLAIDDSADALQLLGRFAAGSRYRLVGAQGPDQAFELAAKIPPQVIVLDVMMPQVDGWEILGRLRQHPLTGDIPIIVCTILAQKDLAALLGASGFLRKPITRSEFLAALDRQTAQRASTPN